MSRLNGNGKNRTLGTVALVGNPNVGKSTVSNCLTGLNQHTGNWPGKTVSLAQGSFTCYFYNAYTLARLGQAQSFA